ncbi:MAG: DUF2934 domain-containing protein [Acidobacteria bacterium]|nr:DUF2934 domain-containing protein [Acidobacteriota bacterium]
MPHFCGKSHTPRFRRQWNDGKPENSEERSARRREEIALLAYSYWDARGRRGGSAEEDWLRAEREWERSHQGA